MGNICDNIDKVVDLIYSNTNPSKLREIDRLIEELIVGNCTHRETQKWIIEDGNDYDSGFSCIKCKQDTYGYKWPAYTSNLNDTWTLVENTLTGPNIFIEVIHYKSTYHAIISFDYEDNPRAIYTHEKQPLALLGATLAMLKILCLGEQQHA